MGVHNTLMKELEDESDKFQSFARVPPDLYHEIVRRVGPRIQKQHTFFRKALSPGLKVAITLRFFGTGISYHSLAHEFRCPHNTISLVISETCEAIIAEYMEESAVEVALSPGGTLRSVATVTAGGATFLPCTLLPPFPPLIMIDGNCCC